MTFVERETSRVHAIREKLFSPEACDSIKDGVHLGPGDQWANLFAEIRNEAREFFSDRKISWHHYFACDPSIVSSQVACLNFFFPMIRDPVTLCTVLQGIYPDTQEILPLTGETPLADGALPFVTFEWIPSRNYLKEPGQWQRGRFVTNVDAVLRARRHDGTIHLVLIEWKYCESYFGAPPKRLSSSGTNRVAIYDPSFARPGCQIELPGSLAMPDLMFDPFDQLMRLQLLASALEREHEMGADAVTVLMIAPKANGELLEEVTAPALRSLGKTIIDVWKVLVKPSTFGWIATEEFLTGLAKAAGGAAWLDYLLSRYGGMA